MEVSGLIKKMTNFCIQMDSLYGTDWLTNSMEQSPSWKPNTSSSTQEIPHRLWNPKVHYRVHKTLALVPAKGHMT